jgi:hypothetical protein
MEMIFLLNLGTDTIKRWGRCWGAMKAIFLSDISTVDGRYLDLLFDPGITMLGSTYQFPREKPTRNDWDHWINF